MESRRENWMGGLAKTLAKGEGSRVDEASMIRFWRLGLAKKGEKDTYNSIKANPESKASPIARVVDSS